MIQLSLIPWFLPECVFLLCWLSLWFSFMLTQFSSWVADQNFFFQFCAHFYPILRTVWIIFLITGIVGCLNCTQKMKTILNTVRCMEGYCGSLCIVNKQIRIFTFNTLCAHCCSVLSHLTHRVLIVAMCCQIYHTVCSLL